MFPYSVEIVGKDEPIDAIKVAYAHNHETGKQYCYILTPDMRIASFDMEYPSHILWENCPNQEAIEFVNRLFDEMMVMQTRERPKIEQGIQYQ